MAEYKRWMQEQYTMKGKTKQLVPSKTFSTCFRSFQVQMGDFSENRLGESGNQDSTRIQIGR